MHITDAESRIMDALWRCGPLGPEEVVAQVADREGWGPATVKTLVNRLLKKKAIRSDRAEGRTRYTATVPREDYVQSESQGLLDRLFEGRLTPLVAHFAQHRALKPEEIKRLKRLLEELDDDAG
jgi:BlaI family penicillinase repressor